LCRYKHPFTVNGVKIIRAVCTTVAWSSSRCDWIVGCDGNVLPLSTEDRETINKNVVEPMASNGLRTICVAYKDYVVGAASRLSCFLFGRSFAAVESEFID